LARIYEVNQDPKVLELLKKTEWYAPVTCGKHGEFWTIPSWKDTWNDENRIWPGGEAVASITGNPYLRGQNDILLSRQKGTKDWSANRFQLAWWRDDVKPISIPDNYTVIDRNIAGPRAWYGRFNYAATLRPIPPDEPGLSTIMGAQVTETNGGLENILMGVYPRIREAKEILNKDRSFNRAAYAWRTSGLKSAIVMGRSFSAVSGSYQLQQYRSSSTGNPVDWIGHQLWLGLPDRIIGLVEVSPSKEGAKAVDVEGIIRLGTGGTVNGKPTKIEQTETNSWRYGDMIVTLFAHNGAKIETPEVPYRLPKFPNTEIRVLDEKAATGSTVLSSYPASFKQSFLVEIRPSWVPTPAAVALIDDPSGIHGFKVSVDLKQFLLISNPKEGDLRYPMTAPADSSLHDSVEGIVSTIPSSINLKPYQLTVLVISPIKEDHLPGWTSYQEMVGQLPLQKLNP